jgi:outer membrane protein OmpA-like peptidoglycan-associated protein
MNRSTFTFLTACVTGLVLSCSAQAQVVSRNQIIDALTAPQVSFSKLGPSRSLTLDNSSSGNTSSGYVMANEQTKPAVDLHDIYFEFDSATISPQAMPQLRELGAALSDPRLAGASFTIGGHTDATGTDAYNTRLSQRRAEAVQRFLVENYTIPSANLHAVGYGKHQPKNKADVFASENRRVEIVNETPRAQAAQR